MIILSENWKEIPMEEARRVIGRGYLVMVEHPYWVEYFCGEVSIYHVGGRWYKSLDG